MTVNTSVAFSGECNLPNEEYQTSLQETNINKVCSHGAIATLIISQQIGYMGFNASIHTM